MPNKKYTLLFIDIHPLGITRPQLLAQGILWWVVDIVNCDLSGAFTLYEYQMPLPLYGSGTNEYAFLAYEQPDYQIDWTEESLVSAT